MATKTQTLNDKPAVTGLSNEEILRYSRHLIMPEVGMEGQLKLKNAKVLLIGTGGLGAPLGLYLAAAGVGKLGLVDFDVVDFTNLQRQVTFGTSDVGKHKSEAARARLANLNPDIEIQSFETQLTSANALFVPSHTPEIRVAVTSHIAGAIVGVLFAVLPSCVSDERRAKQVRSESPDYSRQV